MHSHAYFRLVGLSQGSGPSRLPGRERPRERFVKLASFERRRSARSTWKPRRGERPLSMPSSPPHMPTCSESPLEHIYPLAMPAARLGPRCGGTVNRTARGVKPKLGFVGSSRRFHTILTEMVRHPHMLSEGRERAFLMTTAGGSGPSRLPGRERPRERFVKLACFGRRRGAWSTWKPRRGKRGHGRPSWLSQRLFLC